MPLFISQPFRTSLPNRLGTHPTKAADVAKTMSPTVSTALHAEAATASCVATHHVIAHAINRLPALTSKPPDRFGIGGCTYSRDRRKATELAALNIDFQGRTVELALL